MNRNIFGRFLRLEGLETRSLLSITPTITPDAIWFQAANAAEEAIFRAEGAAFEITDLTAQGLSGRLSLPGLLHQSATVNETNFTRFEVPGWGFVGEVGKPEFPIFRTEFALPAGMEVAADWRVEEWMELGGGVLIWPTQPPDAVSLPTNPFVFDAAAYASPAAFSVDIFSVSEPMAAGDRRTVAVEYCPFAYDATSGQVSVVTEFSFNMSYIPSTDSIGGESGAMGDLGEGGSEPMGGGILVSSAGQADYIIITADAFYEEIQPLAQWKQKMGYKTYVAKMSQIGATYTDVYNYIKAAYDADSTRPQYVLLVGDHENVPAHTVDDYASDYDYARLNGTDVVADIAIGRLPGDTEAQIVTMVVKTLNYERNPDTGIWYDDALLAAQFQDNEGDTPHDLIEDRWFMNSVHRATDFLGGDYDYWSGTDPYNIGYAVHTNLKWDSSVSEILHYKSSKFPGDLTHPDPIPDVWKNRTNEDISTVINAGVGLVIHRDHGSTSGWGSPSYSTSKVNALNNGLYKMPITFSLNCSTGQFDTGDYFGEAWMRNSHGGAVAFTGAMRVSYSGYNDSLLVGIMDSMWTNYSTWSSSNFSPSWHMGQLMNYAKDRVFSGYGYSSGTALRTARLFNVFGDPEIMLRTGTPSALTVTHPASVVQNVTTNFSLQVTKGGSPLSGAKVCISRGNSSDYWVGTTNSSGIVTFSGLKTTEVGLYDVVITERNVVPYQGTFTSMASSPPVVSNPAAANPNPVSGTTAALSVLASDDRGEANLIYTWAVANLPSGAPQPVFSANGTNAAKNSTATFGKIGTYAFQVTIKDGDNLWVSSSVNVTVNAALTNIVVTPAVSNVLLGGTRQFMATAWDQFGAALDAQPAFTWSALEGSITSTGLYSAPTTPVATTVTAAYNGFSSSAAVNVGSFLEPTVATPPFVASAPITGITADLGVLGEDADGSEAELSYTWVATVLPPEAATPVFSANGTNAAKNTAVTFFKAGAYTFQVTILDLDGFSVTASVDAVVEPTLTYITVTPATILVSPGSTQQFAAVGKDQFNSALSIQPTITWSAAAGTITPSGLFTAPLETNAVLITASHAAIQGTATVTMPSSPPSVVTSAAANPSIVTGTTTNLSVLGSDDGGESRLTYTWTYLILPYGAAAPTYSDNGTNSAKNTTATFTSPGTYMLWVTIADSNGLTVTSIASITVNRTVTSITIAPELCILVPGGTQQFSAVAKDQFDVIMSPSPVLTWSATAGTITSGGLYTAPAAFSTATVQATSSSIFGIAEVNAPNLPPTDLLLSNAALDENQAGATVGTLSAVDPDQGEDFAYFIENDPTGKFEVVGDALKLKESETLDYENIASVELILGTTDSGGLSFSKSFVLSIGDRSETLVVGEDDWTAAGLTLQRAEDGKLHVYRTGETLDAVPPHDPAKVLGIDITGRDLTDVMTVAALGTGIPELIVHRATLVLGQANALSAGTSVVIDGGVLNFAGHATAIDNLLVQNNGQVTGTAITNTTTTVESGTLTATSIVCDTLTIGSVAPVAAPPAAASTNSLVQVVKTELPTVIPLEQAAVSPAAESATPVEQPITAPAQEEQEPLVPFTSAVALVAPSQTPAIVAVANPIAVFDDLLDSLVEPEVSQTVAAFDLAPAVILPAVALPEQPILATKRTTPIPVQPAERTFRLARKLALESLESDNRIASSLDCPDILAAHHSRKTAKGLESPVK